ncbi:MAG: protoheme IX farnesyltransferase 1 [Gammaproteobacteria bacterium]|nr:MAG: protoheme IX farnesyltransferase 1 [Gammaproteobacteria bacterium]
MSGAWRAYWALTKPRVVVLIVFTAFVGMLLATPGLPPWRPVVLGLLGIWLAAAGAAAFNHLIERNIDARMARTCGRPLPRGAVDTRGALLFALALSAASMAVLALGVNGLTAVLTFATLIAYAVIYTVYLKRATPQNIVIGGLAGALPPLLGWTAVSGRVDAHALLPCLIIYVWTPPHFWALAVARREDYRRADIPMLPVTHGPALTRLHIVLYAVLLWVVSWLPWLSGMSGWPYLLVATALDLRFLQLAWRLYRRADDRLAMRTFRYSIVYLAALFAALLADHYLGVGRLPVPA